MSDATEFLQLLRTPPASRPLCLLGTIPADYDSGRPPVQFDGESAPGARTFPYLSSYIPAPGDRVLVVLIGRGGVVVGKIV